MSDSYDELAERDTEAVEIAKRRGLVFALDHLGLDGLANLAAEQLPYPSAQRDAEDRAPLALPWQTQPHWTNVAEDDRLILVLRSIVWSERNVQDVIASLDAIGLAGRYAILYLDEKDEAHVVRKKA